MDIYFKEVKNAFVSKEIKKSFIMIENKLSELQPLLFQRCFHSFKNSNLLSSDGAQPSGSPPSHGAQPCNGTTDSFDGAQPSSEEDKAAADFDIKLRSKKTSPQDVLDKHSSNGTGRTSHIGYTSRAKPISEKPPELAVRTGTMSESSGEPIFVDHAHNHIARAETYVDKIEFFNYGKLNLHLTFPISKSERSLESKAGPTIFSQDDPVVLKAVAEIEILQDQASAFLRRIFNNKITFIDVRSDSSKNDKGQKKNKYCTPCNS